MAPSTTKRTAYTDHPGRLALLAFVFMMTAQIAVELPSVVAIHKSWMAGRALAVRIAVTSLRDIGTIPIPQQTVRSWLESIDAPFVALYHLEGDAYKTITSAGTRGDIIFPMIRVETQSAFQALRETYCILWEYCSEITVITSVDPASDDDLFYATVYTGTLRAVLQRRVDEIGLVSLLMALLSGVTIKLALGRRNTSHGERA